MPHIYADDIYGLYFGYGYSIAQDRLFQMEMARRSTQGTVAAVLGPSYVDYDKSTRTLFDPASIRKQIKSLAAKDLDVFEGYAAGINAWLEKIKESPDELMPKQFGDHDFAPATWDEYDVAMIFIGTMNNRYGDFNTEIDNAKILSALQQQHGAVKGSLLFDALNPRFTDNAPTTIPSEDWSESAYDSLALNSGGSSNSIAIATTSLSPKSAVTTGMSNCYILGKSKVSGANSILVNGPQFGWFNPSYVYSVGMHGAGIDVVGNTPFGYPMIMFGHNANISWGSTWGASDIVDIYAEKVNPDDRSTYWHNNKLLKFESRVELIEIKGATDLQFEVRRSIHGPIIHADEAAKVAFAKKRAWDGGELDSLLAWLSATWAGDFDEWKSYAEKSAINVNMYFADVDGNIGYFHGGKFPQRAAGHDNRLPISGAGDMEWLGRMPIETANPHVLNPSSGYLANWNNKPGQGVMNPDFFFYSWSAADRVDFLHAELTSKKKFTADEAWAVIESSSFADVYAPYFLEFLELATQDTEDAGLREANNILQAWDGRSTDSDTDGFYDGAATAIFRTFIGELIHRTLADDLGDAYTYFSATGYPTHDKPTGAGTNIPPAVKLIVEALNGRVEYDIFNGEPASTIIASALKASLMELATEKGQEVASLRLPVASRPFSMVNFLGIPQGGNDETLIASIEQNRGTENNMIVMKPGAIVAYEVAPPGQSGFVSSSGQRDPHYSDQFDLYQSFGKKRIWFYAADVADNAASEDVVTYSH